MTYPPGTQLNLTRAILASPTRLLPLAVRRRLRHHRPWQLARLTQRAAVWATTPAAADRDCLGHCLHWSLYELLFILVLVSRVQIEKEV